MESPKSTRFCIRINTKLYEWIKEYAQRMNTNASAVVKSYFDTLRAEDGHTLDEPLDARKQSAEVQRLVELNEERANQIQHLRDQLTEKDNQLVRRDEQIDHFQQIVAMSQKNIGALTEQLSDSRQLIEDMRQRKTVWQRLKAVFVTSTG